MPSCCATTTLHYDDRNGVPAFTIVRHHYHHDEERSHHYNRRGGQELLPASQQHHDDGLLQQGSSLSNGADDDHSMIQESMTIQPNDVNMIITVLLGGPCPRASKDDGAEPIEEKKAHALITMNPKSLLLDIITEVLDLVSDEEDDFFLDNASFAPRS